MQTDTSCGAAWAQLIVTQLSRQPACTHINISISITYSHRRHGVGHTTPVARVATCHLPHPPCPALPPQWTMFFKDPSGNSLEFKAMTNPDNLFAKYYVSD